MNKLLTVLLAIGAAATASAQFYAGASAGYLIDLEEEFVTARVGYDIATRGTYTHSLEVEVGYITESEPGARLEMTPIMANYRVANAVSDKTSLEFGIGLGTSLLDVNLNLGGYGYSDSDSSLTAQALVGAEYRLNNTVSVTGVARYIWVDDAFGTEIGDDVGLEAGIKFRF